MQSFKTFCEATSNVIEITNDVDESEFLST